MYVHDLPAVRLIVREDDSLHDPVYTYRRGHRTVLMWDPRATRLQVVAGLVDKLTPEEFAVVAAGFHLPMPLPDWCTTDDPAFCFVPRALRLPGAPALQGGAEWARRSDGQRVLERAAFRAERLSLTVDLQHVYDLTRV